MTTTRTQLAARKKTIRNLYLSTQLAELHIPMLLVFNMSDEAKKKGLKFDIQKLQSYFGCSIVQTVGSRGLFQGLKA